MSGWRRLTAFCVHTDDGEEGWLPNSVLLVEASEVESVWRSAGQESGSQSVPRCEHGFEPSWERHMSTRQSVRPPGKLEKHQESLPFFPIHLAEEVGRIIDDV